MEMTAEAQHLKTLYEASLSGCVATLNDVIQRDPLALNRVSLSNLTETPLHVSSLLGHLEFTLALLQRCPKMAVERDSLRRLPLHLACAEGHAEVAKALLSACSTDYRDVCLARDRDGRIPLHLAAIRGRVDLIPDLVAACPESVSELLNGDTVFHMCVKYNQLDAFKLLVGYADVGELLTRGNQVGNTILHLAALLKDFEVISYLLSLNEVKERVNALNNVQQTALDLIELLPSIDIHNVRIRDVLTAAGARRAADLSNNSISTLPTPNSPPDSKLMRFAELDIKRSMGTFMIIATVIATLTYQAALNPPGGVWQQNSIDPKTGFGCNATSICEAGKSVIAHTHSETYYVFMSSNIDAFLASLMVIITASFGFLRQTEFFVFLSYFATVITLTFSTVSFFAGISMVTPSNLKLTFSDFWIHIHILGLLACMLFGAAVVYVIYSVRFGIVKDLRKVCGIRGRRRCRNPSPYTRY